MEMASRILQMPKLYLATANSRSRHHLVHSSIQFSGSNLLQCDAIESDTLSSSRARLVLLVKYRLSGRKSAGIFPCPPYRLRSMGLLFSDRGSQSAWELEADGLRDYPHTFPMSLTNFLISYQINQT